MDISIIGGGNMAYRLGIALRDAGHSIPKVWCRKSEVGEKLAAILASEGGNTVYTYNQADLFDSDLIVIAVSDNAISEVASNLAQNISEQGLVQKPVVVHTSGATPIDALAPLMDAGAKCGVLYPMMTLSKNKNIDFKEVPILIEHQDEDTGKMLEEIAFSLRCEYFSCDSQRRLQMHCAAVFASNFVNYALSLAYELAGDKAPYLIPTAIESVRKCCIFHPDQVQTGPALRGDHKTLEKHLELLEKLGMEEHGEIYRLISKNIPGRVKKDK